MKLKGRLPGAALLLPLVPALWSYLATRHLGFAVYGLNKPLLVLGIAFLFVTFPTTVRFSATRMAVYAAALGLMLWSQAAFFSVFAVFFGVAGYLVWWSVLPGRLVRGLVLWSLFGIVLLPFVHLDTVRLLRDVSLTLVDMLLWLSRTPFERAGFTYFVTIGSGSEMVPVLEQCSGASTVRVLCVAFSALFLWTRGPSPLILSALPLAVLGGLCSNALRIALHLWVSRATGHIPSDSGHELLGLFTFSLVLASGLGVAWRFRTSSGGLDGGTIPVNAASSNVARPPGGSPEQSVAPALRKALAPRSVLVTAGVAFALHIGVVMPQPATKELTSDYRSGPAFAEAEGTDTRVPLRLHVNHLVEGRGGGGWVLLEHPLEYCFAVRGLDRPNVALESPLPVTPTVTGVYTVGTHTTTRSGALLLKWVHPGLWSAPVHAEIRVVESLGL